MDDTYATNVFVFLEKTSGLLTDRTCFLTGHPSVCTSRSQQRQKLFLSKNGCGQRREAPCCPTAAPGTPAAVLVDPAAYIEDHGSLSSVRSCSFLAQGPQASLGATPS